MSIKAKCQESRKDLREIRRNQPRMTSEEALSQTRRANGSLFEAVKEVVWEMGCDPVELDFSTAQEMKAAARAEDERLLRL